MRAAYRGGEVFAAVREANPPLEPFDRIVVGESDGLPAPEARTPDGFTPLHIAAFSHNLAAARKLLEAGADPNVIATASFARVTPLGTCAFTEASAKRASPKRLRAIRRATCVRPRASRTPRGRRRP